MSNSKLRKSLKKIQVQDCSLKCKPVLISDSKGRYLKSVTGNSTVSKIEWFCRSGATSVDTYSWLHTHLKDLVTKHKEISLYIWIGTCDFTSKEKRYIALQKSDKLELFKSQLLKIKDLCSSCKVKLTFLHIPYYSIQLWNKSKGHPNPEHFKSDDERLNKYIDEANKFIDDLNTDIGSHSPRLNQDLVRSRKKKGHKARYSINFSLFKDGIHPGYTLSQTWLANICKTIITDCA